MCLYIYFCTHTIYTIILFLNHICICILYPLEVFKFNSNTFKPINFVYIGAIILYFKTTYTLLKAYNSLGAVILETNEN